MILIIDFGSQFNQLIARRVRENHVYCQIESPEISAKRIRELAPSGIILSGGPASIYASGSPKMDSAVFDLGIPVLGICYGLHFMVSALGGKVKQAGRREYGFAELSILQKPSPPVRQKVRPARFHVAGHVLDDYGDGVRIYAEALVELLIAELRDRALGHLFLRRADVDYVFEKRVID